MSKNARKSRRKKETSKTGARQSQSQRVLPLVDVLVGAQDALFTSWWSMSAFNLYRVLRSTNPIENLNGRIQATARNVKRWRGGAMAVRWAVAGIMEASKKFRRIQGYKQMPTLLAALSAHAEEKGLQQQRMIA